MAEFTKATQPSGQRCRPEGAVLTRRITAAEALPAVGEQASLEKLQAYLASRIGRDVGKVVSAEDVVGGLMGPDAVAIHISFSWG
mgnify:CR=1 FL=1